MKGACAIAIDVDKIFLSFAGIKRTGITFSKEATLDACCGGDIVQLLKLNSESLKRKIKGVEQESAMNIKDIYLGIPHDMEKERSVEESVPLKRYKKITLSDINFVKRQIQDISLDWDDYCLHHFILSYDIDGAVYKKPPLGLWAKKIKINSQLLWIKEKQRRQIKDIFSHINLKLAGLISCNAAVVSMFKEYLDDTPNLAVVLVGQNSSYLIIYQNGFLRPAVKFSFSIKSILDETAKGFCVPFPLANDVFEHYASFVQMPYSKEISIKNDDNYINLSTQTLNSFLKHYVKEQLSAIFEEAKNKSGENLSVALLGRLNAKEGFIPFVKEFSPYPLKIFQYGEGSWYSLGCLRYGINRLLENQPSKSLLQKITETYREYF